MSDQLFVGVAEDCGDRLAGRMNRIVFVERENAVGDRCQDRLEQR